MTLSGHKPPTTLSVESAFTDSALEFATRPVADFLEHPERLAPASQALAAYLAQLEIEGFAAQGQEGVSIAWEDLYRLLDHPDH
ncbi:MAG: hypothetical protein Q8O37_12780, partial [Sulfuricellaceae bacterium]|nr:hypothetical protein [Sulfuricellaceae bacterium]